MRGTRAALYEKGRESITITIPEVNALQVGALIALYERAVGFYGSLVNVNAYHQPGVEAGKKAATRLLELQGRARAMLSEVSRTNRRANWRRALKADPEDVYHVLRHLAANDDSVGRTRRPKSPSPRTIFFTLMSSHHPTRHPRASTRDVPWNDVVRFVRQLSHDLRNHLNAIELQSTFLAELAQDGEMKPEVQRLREMTYEIGVTLSEAHGRDGRSQSAIDELPRGGFR